MSFDVTVHPSCEVFSFNRAPVNAMTLESVVAVGDWFESYHNQSPIILTGTGKAFSAGVDTKAFMGYSTAERAALFDAITRTTAALCSITVPVVAAINGHALGGGMVISLCTDYRICAEGEHKFGLTEARAGVPFPDGPIEIINHEIPVGLLRSLTLSSRIVGAAELERHGVIDEIVAQEDVLSRAIAVAADMHSQPAFKQVKQQLRGGLVQRLKALL